MVAGTRRGAQPLPRRRRFIAIRAAILPISQPMQKAENCDGRVQDLLSSGVRSAAAHSGNPANGTVK
jgi:hypothetical protein